MVVFFIDHLKNALYAALLASPLDCTPDHRIIVSMRSERARGCPLALFAVCTILYASHLVIFHLFVTHTHIQS